jgi:probable rRNA maturation factor
VPTSVISDVSEPVPKARICRTIGGLLRRHGVRRAEVCVRITDDDAVRELNGAYRRIDRVTDVLSFGYAGGITPETAAEAVQALQGTLGDIVIAYPTSHRQAVARGVGTDDELVHLAAHGCLHLLGYDDDTPEALTVMEALAYEAMGARGAAMQRTAAHSQGGNPVL